METFKKDEEEENEDEESLTEWKQTPQEADLGERMMTLNKEYAASKAAGDTEAMKKIKLQLAKLAKDKSIIHPMNETDINESQGNAMREHTNLVKNLRRLLETEVSQAEVMMAAKGFAQELQEMVEKIGRLQNEDLPPVTDQMRETYGTGSASAFQTQIYSAFQGVMDALYTAKNQVDDAVSNMASTGQVGASVDMDKDMGAGDPNAEAGMDDAGMEMDGDLDLDNIGDELGDEEPAPDMGAEAGDEFGGAEEEEPLGRAMKEAALQRKVMEMKKLVSKARKLKEARK